MSDIHSERWLESAHENFEQALQEGDVGQAKAIIADTLDAGFGSFARTMNRQLRNATLVSDERI